MKGYHINFTQNTMTITSAFQTAANNPASEEYKLLAQIKADYPTMKIIRKSRRTAKRCNPSKGLTYANMERYMKVYKNAAELLEQFEKVKKLAAVHPNRYLYVKNWFISQFPNYKELPDFESINLNVTIVPAPQDGGTDKAA